MGVVRDLTTDGEAFNDGSDDVAVVFGNRDRSMPDRTGHVVERQQALAAFGGHRQSRHGDAVVHFAEQKPYLNRSASERSDL